MVSVLVSGFIPLRVQASRVPSNDPPYVIRGHVYITGTTDGLADAGIRLHFQACDDGEPYPRVVDLPLTGVLGSWEFDENDWLEPGGTGAPCAGATFTIEQQVLPAGYVVEAVKTPSDPEPVPGDTILLETEQSGTYEGLVHSNLTGMGEG